MQPDLAFNHAYVRYELEEFAAAVFVLEELCGITNNPITWINSKVRTSPAFPFSRQHSTADACHPKQRRRKFRVPGPSDRKMEHKWVDLLVKSYVKTGRTAEAVVLTDFQLSMVQQSKGTDALDAMVFARVAFNVYPWRCGGLPCPRPKTAPPVSKRPSPVSKRVPPVSRRGLCLP